MKFHFPLFLLGLFIMGITQAQQAEPVNSGALIAEGIKLHDAKKYKEAIEQYRKVPRNDTNYSYALYEVAYSLYAEKELQTTINTIREGLALDDNSHELEFYILLGSAVDDLDQTEKAIQIYDSALLKYPNSLLLRLNKGITLMRLEKLDEAEDIFQQILLFNPFYSSAHYRLGQCALRRGQVLQAMMCDFTYLINYPDGPHSGTVVKLLGNLSKNTDDIKEAVNKRTKEQTGNFAMVEQIILSGIALDKGYKVLTDLDDPIIRQLQVMMEKLEYDSQDPDFFMQFYVPYLKDVFNSKLFEPAVYRAFSDVNLESIQKYVKKNGKEITRATDFISQHLEKIRSTRILDYEKRITAAPQYHFDGGYYYAKGFLNNEKTHGRWEFFHKNGNLKSSGEYVNGKKQGKWTYYYNTGEIGGFDTWVDGVQHGEDVTYNNFGVVSVRTWFKNGEQDGERTSYYALGHPYTVSTYKEGKETGKYTQYYSNGRVNIIAGTLDDELHGSYQAFHTNGKKKIVANYEKSKFHGKYQSFHDNGQLEFEINYQHGIAQGEAVTYHPNGVLKRKVKYVDDLLEGEETIFNDRKVLVEKTNFKKGKADGLAEFFDNDGKLYSTFNYNNNKLNEAKYFDKSGKEIGQSVRKNKMIDMVIYNPAGYKVKTVSYNDDAQIVGTETFFYNSGQPKEINLYKEGELHGICVGYYPNGSKKYEVQYENGEKHGFVKNYSLNGRISSEGWYQDGKLNGNWLEYDQRGTLINFTTYLNNDIYGVKQSFTPNGKLADEEFYKAGWIVGNQQYDTVGNKLSLALFPNGSGKWKGIYPNQKTRYEGEYVNTEVNGPFKLFYFDGSIQVSKIYDKGLLHGEYTDYYYGGQVNTQGKYDMGKKTGTWKTHYPNGKLSKEEVFVNGEQHGVSKYYFTDGRIEKEVSYWNGEREGEFKRYSFDGQLVSIVFYNSDQPVQYTYQGKDQKLVPAIAIPGGSGKVKTFYANGNVSTEMEFKDGLLNGPYKVFHPNGKVYYEEENLVCGETNGRLTEYYPTGQVRHSYNYVYDKVTGPYKEYYENGKLSEEGIFYEGQLHGPRKLYDATGKLTSTQHIYYGIILNVTK